MWSLTTPAVLPEAPRDHQGSRLAEHDGAEPLPQLLDALLEDAHVQATEHLARFVLDGTVLGQVPGVDHVGRPPVGLSGADRLCDDAVAGDVGTDGALAVGLADVRGDTQQIASAVHGLEDRAGRARQREDIIHERSRHVRVGVLSEPGAAETQLRQRDRPGGLRELVDRRPGDLLVARLDAPLSADEVEQDAHVVFELLGERSVLRGEKVAGVRDRERDFLRRLLVEVPGDLLGNRSALPEEDAEHPESREADERDPLRGELRADLHVNPLRKQKESSRRTSPHSRHRA